MWQSLSIFSKLPFRPLSTLSASFATNPHNHGAPHCSTTYEWELPIGFAGLAIFQYYESWSYRMPEYWRRQTFDFRDRWRVLLWGLGWLAKWFFGRKIDYAEKCRQCEIVIWFGEASSRLYEYHLVRIFEKVLILTRKLEKNWNSSLRWRFQGWNPELIFKFSSNGSILSSCTGETAEDGSTCSSSGVATMSSNDQLPYSTTTSSITSTITPHSNGSVSTPSTVIDQATGAKINSNQTLNGEFPSSDFPLASSAPSCSTMTGEEKWQNSLG